MLEAEAERFVAELAASTGSLEEMQFRSTQAAQELAAELSPLRIAFRKRCRQGMSNAVHLSCALTVLEAEAFAGGSHSAATGDPAMVAASKRARILA